MLFITVNVFDGQLWTAARQLDATVIQHGTDELRHSVGQRHKDSGKYSPSAQVQLRHRLTRMVGHQVTLTRSW